MLKTLALTLTLLLSFTVAPAAARPVPVPKSTRQQLTQFRLLQQTQSNASG